jgi:peptide/nickel transport system substrate-binding protein
MKAKTTIALGVVAVLAFSACANTPATTPGETASVPATAAAGGTLTYARPGTVTSWDLHKEITSNNAFAIDKVFESLLTFDANGSIVDHLAESHEVSADGLTYTFKLRSGLKFSDGTEVTAEDVVFSINRHLNTEDAPLPISAKVKSVTATDASTATITLEEPSTPFLAELSNFANGVIPKDFGGKTEEEFFKNPIGTGPWVVESWDPAGDITFVKNPNYWQEGKPLLDKLVYKLVEDDTQAINQLKAGEVDAIESVSAANAGELANGADTQVITNGSWVIEQIFFNTKDEHFADVHVRRAIALTLDRKGITDASTFGYADVADALLPPTIPYSTSGTIKALDLDLEAAKAELAQSKFPDGFSTKVIVPSGFNDRAQEAQILQAAAKQLGITVEIETLELATFRERFFAYDFSIMINSGQADAPEANSILAFQTDPEGFSKSYWTQYTNDEVTKLLYQGQTQPDGDDRAATYATLQQILADEVPYIPLYYPQVLKAARSNVRGIVLLPNDSVRFENVSIAS